MLRHVLADIETNGLLDTVSLYHCSALMDLETGKKYSATDQSYKSDTHEVIDLTQSIDIMNNAEVIYGHNWIAYDDNALRKIRRDYKPRSDQRVVDTLISSRTARPDLKPIDWTRIEKEQARINRAYRQLDNTDLGKVIGPSKNPVLHNIMGNALKLESKRFPKKLAGRHSLEAWGWRLGVFKGDYSEMMKAKGLDPWAEWNWDMQLYVEQDIAGNKALLDKLPVYSLPIWALGADAEHSPGELEHKLYYIIRRQEAFGWQFNEKKAEKLCGKLLVEKAKKDSELQQAVPPWFVGAARKQVKKTVVRQREDLGTVEWKRFSVKTGKQLKSQWKGVPETHFEGAESTPVKLTTFNPGSRDHIANRLKALYGWKPTEFTNDGKPKVDEDVLEKLTYPIAKLLLQSLTLGKRLGQLAEGRQALMKSVKGGRIHGSVNQLGANTHRMTHSNPNVSQVPKSSKEYGEGFRECFEVPPGFKLVGCDADALELRCLAGVLAKIDGGEYIKTILEGKKDEGTDIHSRNARALGCDRDTAKIWFYAWLYGSGDANLGFTLGATSLAHARKLGRKSRTDFMNALPHVKKFVAKVQKLAKAGKIPTIDGRMVYVRSEHSAVNALLQSTGAIIMKRAQVLLDKYCQDNGCVPGVDYEFVGTIHDEWQIQARIEIAEQVGQIAEQAIRDTADFYAFRCPLDGNADIGNNWHETH